MQWPFLIDLLRSGFVVAFIHNISSINKSTKVGLTSLNTLLLLQIEDSTSLCDVTFVSWPFVIKGQDTFFHFLWSKNHSHSNKSKKILCQIYGLGPFMDKSKSLERAKTNQKIPNILYISLISRREIKNSLRESLKCLGCQGIFDFPSGIFDLSWPFQRCYRFVTDLLPFRSVRYNVRIFQYASV